MFFMSFFLFLSIFYVHFMTEQTQNDDFLPDQLINNLCCSHYLYEPQSDCRSLLGSRPLCGLVHVAQNL